jgi:hypothetical protein
MLKSYPLENLHDPDMAWNAPTRGFRDSVQSHTGTVPKGRRIPHIRMSQH